MIIVDSLRKETIDQRIMPVLAGYPGGRWLEVETCLPNLSFACIQTALSGRDSSYAGALRDLVPGHAGDSGLPAMAAAHGYPVGIVGNHVLHSMYRHAARWAELVESEMPDRAGQDVLAIGRARTLAKNPALRLLVLHLASLDRVAHFRHPGTPRSLMDHARVDRALGGLLADLVPDRDDLVVFGDHGHDQGGDHTHRSVAMFAGPSFAELLGSVAVPETIAQRDLLYLMVYPFALPLPADYEGALFFGRDSAQAPPAVARFEAMQRGGLTRSGYTGGRLTARLSPSWRPGTERARATFVRQLPLIAGFVLWVWLLYAGADRRQPTAPWLRTAVTIGIVVVLAALLGRFVWEWWTYFKALRWWPRGQVMLMVFTISAGGALAWLRFRRFAAFPWGAQMLCFFALPSGFIFAAFSNNVVRAFHTAWLLKAVGSLPVRDQRRVHGRALLKASAFLAAMFPLLFWHGPGPLWRLAVTVRLDRSEAASWLAYAAASAALAALVTGARRRGILAALLMGFAFYTVGFAGLPPAALATASLFVVFAAGWLRWCRPLADVQWREEEEALLLAAVAVLALLASMGGFQIGQVDFSFAADIHARVANERALYFIVTLLTVLKYCAMDIALLAFLILSEGASRTLRLMETAAVFMYLKLACLLLQIGASSLEPRVKLYELAVSDFIFVYALTALGAVAYASLAAAVWLRRSSMRSPTPRGRNIVNVSA